MKLPVYLEICIRIIVMCVIGMLFTFVPDQLREFFGDTYCADGTYTRFGNTYKGCRYEIIDDGYYWGARHYWYWWMMFFLFITSLVSSVIAIINAIKKHYPEV